MTFLKQFLNEDAGQDLIEYSLLLGFIALFAAGIIGTGVAADIETIWNNADTTLDAATGTTP